MKWIVYVMIGWLLGVGVTKDTLSQLRTRGGAHRRHGGGVPAVRTRRRPGCCGSSPRSTPLTALLATAPGGIAQMEALSATAGANVPIVLTVHVLRITSVIVLMTVGLKLMGRISVVDVIGPRRAGRLGLEGGGPEPARWPGPTPP